MFHQFLKLYLIKIKLSFTGGEVGGSNVECIGKEIKTVLELGGSDSFIVLNDANIDLASKAAVTARFLNAGQSCIAAMISS